MQQAATTSNPLCVDDLKSVASALTAIDRASTCESAESQNLSEVLDSFLLKGTFVECLVFAVRHGCQEVTEHLLTRFTDACSPETLALALCVSVRYTDSLPSPLLARFLAGFSPSASFYLNPLLVACATGQVETLRTLLEKSELEGVLLSTRPGHVSLLAVACAYGQEEVVRTLIAARADSDYSSPTVREFEFDERLDIPTRCLGRDLVETCLRNGHYQLTLLWLSNGSPLLPAVQSDPECQDHLRNLLAGRTSESDFKLDASDMGDATDGGGASVHPVLASWDNLSLRRLQTAWLPRSPLVIVHLNISDNKIEQLPVEVFYALPHLSSINVSYNELESLDVPASHTCLSAIAASNNKLSSISSSIFQLPKLASLALSQNQLTSLCACTEHSTCCDGIASSVLSVVDVSSNKLQACLCPLTHLPQLADLSVAKNELPSLPRDWKTLAFRKLNASYNCLTEFITSESVKVPECPRCFETLDTLILSNNNLGFFPLSVCAMSQLSVLDLSHNRMQSLPRVHFWQCSLSKLDLGSNRLQSHTEVIVMHDIDPFGDDEDDNYRLFHDDKPKKSSKKKSFKRSATAADQSDGWLTVSGPRATGSATGSEMEAGEVEELRLPVSLFRSSLVYLRLQDNCLANIPPDICELQNLVDLDLSHNPELKNLIAGLGKLRNCYQIGIRGLEIQNVPKELLPGSPNGSTRRTLAYLRATLRRSERYNRIKLMVVGLQGRGKTSLLARLRGENMPDNLSTVGVKVDNWKLKRPIQAASRPFLLKRASAVSSQVTDYGPIVLSTWDMAGQEVYYATHQCFLSSNTLYLAVWSLDSGKKGVENLRMWLINIQARAPGSPVIIVGTHLDQLPAESRKAKVQQLRSMIRGEFADQKGYPKIVGIVEVSNTIPKLDDGITLLQQAIYDAAINIVDPNSKEKLVQRQVPASYLSLQQAVSHRAQEMKEAEEEVPILTHVDYLKMVSEIPNNDITDEEELCLATRFLHENGVLLHYEEQLNGLDQLYFIDCAWLCDLLAEVVAVPEKQRFIKDGLLPLAKVGFIFSSRRFPSTLIPQYLQLLEKFEIAIKLSDKYLLVPSMLPRKPPPDLDLSQWASSHMQSSAESSKAEPVSYIQRIYCMAYVPSGFWSRLTARLIISLDRITVGESNVPFLPSLATWAERSASTSARSPSLSPKALARKPSTAQELYLWSSGLCVRGAGACFCIQSLDSTLGRRRIEGGYEDLKLPDGSSKTGIVIHMWSNDAHFPVFPHLVDGIDGLIEEWFPGLCDIDVTGEPLVQRLVAHRITEHADGMGAPQAAALQFADITSLDYVNVHFPVGTCALAALAGDKARWSDFTIPLLRLTPEFLLSDLPAKLLLKRSLLKFTASNKTLLGRGGAGAVYRASYDGVAVAMKQFSSSVASYPESRSAAHSPVMEIISADQYRELSFEALQAGEDAMALLRQLRQEITVLQLLQHPCVVRLIGVQLHPIAFALELAPMGSLFDVIESRALQYAGLSTSSLQGPVLGHALTQRILIQVATALDYLHSKDIIYRDLKSDNVLVWSMYSPSSEDDGAPGADHSRLINVRLSDYGISRVATPGGLKGQEGTPGFLAPEAISKNGALRAYDNKVDIFSFAMFIFELLSGARPFGEMDNPTDISRAVTNHQRPVVSRHVAATLFPRVEEMMAQCWHHTSLSRPTAAELIRSLEDLSLLCERHRHPPTEEGVLDKAQCLSAWQPAPRDTHLPGSRSSPTLWNTERTAFSHVNPDDMLVMWHSRGDERLYSFIDCFHGSAIQPPMSQDRSEKRIDCTLKVEDTVWVGSDRKVIVYSLDSASNALIKVWERTAGQLLVTTMDVLYMNGVCRSVYTLNQDGSIEVFSRPTAAEDVLQEWPCRYYSMKHVADGHKKIRAMLIVSYAAESDPCDDDGDEQADDLHAEENGFAQNGGVTACHSVGTVRHEVWCSCDGMLYFYDAINLQPVCPELEVSRSKQPLREMVLCRGIVWAVDHRQPLVVALCPKRHSVICVLDCRAKAERPYRSPCLAVPTSSGELPPAASKTGTSSSHSTANATSITDVPSTASAGNSSTANATSSNISVTITDSSSGLLSPSLVSSGLPPLAHGEPNRDSLPSGARSRSPALDHDPRARSLTSIQSMAPSSSYSGGLTVPPLHGSTDVVDGVSTSLGEPAVRQRSMLPSKGSATNRMSLPDLQISSSVSAAKVEIRPLQSLSPTEEERSIVLEGTAKYVRNNCTDLVVVAGNLWVARASGDILIIEPSLDNGCPFLARLQCQLPADPSTLDPSTNHLLCVCSGGRHVASYLELVMQKAGETVPHCTVWAACDSQLIQEHRQHSAFLKSL